MKTRKNQPINLNIPLSEEGLQAFLGSLSLEQLEQLREQVKSLILVLKEIVENGNQSNEQRTTGEGGTPSTGSERG